MIEIRMPRLSESMTEGKLLLWSVAVGDRVEAGDQLAEIEADKANMEIEAPVAGVVCALHGSAGETVPVGQMLIELRAEEGDNAGNRRVGPAKGADAAEPGSQVESPLDRRKKHFESREQ